MSRETYPTTKSAPTTAKPGGLAMALRIARAARGLRSRDVEKDVGVRPGYLSQLENGTRTPRAETLRRLEKALGVSQTTIALLSLEKAERDRMGDEVLGILAWKALLELTK